MRPRAIFVGALLGCALLLGALPALGAPPPSNVGVDLRFASSTNPGNNSNSSGPNLTYTVTFLANGLPPGLRWAVALGSRAVASTSGEASFADVPAGNAAFEVGPPSGYAATPSSGSLSIHGDVRVALVFAPSTPTSPGLTLWPLAPTEVTLLVLIGVLGGGAVVAVELFERRRARRASSRPDPRESESPPPN